MPPVPTEARVPLNILTGFLGSGKTTVLRHILRCPEFADTAVLINEFGEVGLDHLLVGRLDETPVLLPSGCICCSIRGDLSRAVRDLFSRRQRGLLGVFRRVVVETTGLADPTPILATITADLVIRRNVRPGNIVATVDALHAEAGLERHRELLKQAAIADRLIVTKTDLAAPAAVARLREVLHRLNPSAAIMEAVRGAVDPEFLIRQDAHDPETRLAEMRQWMANEAPEPPGAQRHGAITSFCVHIAGPLDWNLFGLWFSLLVHRHGAALLRVKGILEVLGSPTPVAIHAVQHVIHSPEHLPAWPTEERGSRIVFITDGLAEEKLRRSLQTFARLAEPAARPLSRGAAPL